jgi:uncharacterized protein (TIGR02145 family)
MKKTLLFAAATVCCAFVANAQNISVQQNVNINLPVIEKTVYVDKYRTVYVDRPQPKRVAKKLSAPLQLLGYLWVYPEDIGNFKQPPLHVIEMINKQGLHGHNNWRIPTPDELALLEANADKVGLGDDIYLATDHANGVLRLIAREETQEEKAERVDGVLVNGAIWAKTNVGASSISDKGREFNSFSAAQTACPNGWRLPTNSEFRNLLNSGEASFGGRSHRLFFPYTKVYSGTWASTFFYKYWTSSGHMLYYESTSSNSMGYGKINGSDSNEDPTLVNVSSGDNGMCVRCVLAK